jgi:hypothetical protein
VIATMVGVLGCIEGVLIGNGKTIGVHWVFF